MGRLLNDNIFYIIVTVMLRLNAPRLFETQ